MLKLASLSPFVGEGERDYNSHQVLLFVFWCCVCSFVKASWSRTGKNKGAVAESCIEDKGRGREHRQKGQILEVNGLLGRGPQTRQVIGYLESHLLKWCAVCLLEMLVYEKHEGDLRKYLKF